MGEVDYPALVRATLGAPPRLGDVRLVAVDGGTGAGKSTVAAGLAAALAAAGRTVAVVAADDLLDGWSDVEGAGSRIRDLVLTPLAAGATARYHPYDWHAGRFGDKVREVAPPGVLILEGVGAGRGMFRPYLSLLIYVDAPLELRFARVLARDGEEIAGPLRDWIADETAHLAANGTREASDVYLIPTECPDDPKEDV
ncbi:hypothetical protein Afil01_08560 [Actinorhabdospora filicis]|uniref:CobQ/CobB/MinD/ParA nucleotide binding domain-containing protein n=1 Tax=Actinorhabdospora filicis TaxID=1785913 RepID=A0A9W6SF59_9ACTN|nr:hypothetical protein [Actinorhabdospora filicis]GLZ76049.1 hypothetical protein Afil01_08560 [Actinorhabdospora filicis]